MFPPNLYMFHGEIPQKARVLALQSPISSTSFGKKSTNKHPNKHPIRWTSFSGLPGPVGSHDLGLGLPQGVRVRRGIGEAILWVG